MTVRAEITQSELAKAIHGSKGVQVQVAANLTKTRRALQGKHHPAITRKQISYALDKFPECRELLNHEGEDCIDTIGAKMYHLAESGDLDAMKFTLDRKGRQHGWGREDKLKVEGSGLVVRIDKDEADI